MAVNNRAKLYMAVICALGIGDLVLSTLFFPVHNIWGMVFFCFLALIAETQSVSIGNAGAVSLGSAVIIAAILMCGPGASGWVAAVSVCGSITKIDDKRYHIFNTNFFASLFNIGNYVLSISVISLLFTWMHGTVITKTGISFTQALSIINDDSFKLIVAIIAGTLTNVVLVSVCLVLRGSIRDPKTFLLGLIYPFASLFLICLLGIFLTALYVAYGWFLVVLFFLPFMLARYVFITYKDLQQSYIQTIDSLASAIETKDPYTSGHSKRVQKYSLMIAREMKLPAKKCETLRYAALLHDVGKIGIPETILNKPGRLTDEEWAYIRSHPEKGAHILEDIKFLKDTVEIVRSHHERYDGKGYPQGKSAKELPLEAMILCAADSYDAMTSDRPYRGKLSADTAMGEMKRNAGTQFAPEVVEAFGNVLLKNGTLKR